MQAKNHFKKLTLIALLLTQTFLIADAQTNQPRQERLLNNLKVLIWSEPQAQKATVKLRIHSGAAFDLQNKEGTLALLADILFPTDAAKQFFSEELGGSLAVESNYDYIQINATGDNDQIVRMLETISAAVIKPQIDKETTAQVKTARLTRIGELEKNPSYIADLAVANRLYGNYPSGRSAAGTSATLAKIDFADILLAKQRFLTADNATLAVSGNFKSDYIYKAVRQLFGGWEKSDKKIPATFAQPTAPDTKFYLIKTELDNASELRFAFRGAARGDKDIYAAQILSRVLENRLQTKEGGKVLLQQNSYLLPGLITVKFSNWQTTGLNLAGTDVSLSENFSNYVADLLKPNVTSEEFQTAKSDFTKNFNSRSQIDAWLDADTYKLPALKIDAQTAQNATLADVQAILERWRKEAVVKTLLIKSA